MDVTPLISSKNSVVQAYGPDGIKVSGQTYDHCILVQTNSVTPFNAQTFEALTEGHIQQLSNENIDVLLVGTGAAMHMLPANLRKCAQEHKLNIETMDTGAACRTFNVLMSDGRNIAALLFLPQ